MRKSVIILFFIILVSCPLMTFAATNFYDDDSNFSQDPSYLIKLDYDNKSEYFIKLLEQTKTVNPENYNTLINLINNNQFIYIKNISTAIWRAYFINGMSNSTIHSHYPIGSYTSIPDEEYDHVSNYYFEIGWTPENGYVFNRVNTVTHQYIPVPIDLYTNDNLYNYCHGIINGDTTTVIGILNNIDNSINTNNQKMDELKQTMQNVDNTLKNEDDSDVNYGVDTPSIDSSSVDGAFTGIFTMFYNSMTSVIISRVSFPVPFSNGQSIDVPSNLVSNIFSRIGFDSYVRGILGTIWYFLVGLYILKDIHKISEDIKSGDIMTKTDTDVKADML